MKVKIKGKEYHIGWIIAVILGIILVAPIFLGLAKFAVVLVGKILAFLLILLLVALVLNLVTDEL